MHCLPVGVEAAGTKVHQAHKVPPCHPNRPNLLWTLLKWCASVQLRSPLISLHIFMYVRPVLLLWVSCPVGSCLLLQLILTRQRMAKHLSCHAMLTSLTSHRRVKIMDMTYRHTATRDCFRCAA